MPENKAKAPLSGALAKLLVLLATRVTMMGGIMTQKRLIIGNF